jgi:hypothetical protein
MNNKSLTIQQKLLSVQNELKAPKGQFNSFGKYKYRSCEDVLEALKPLLSKYELNLILTDEISEVGGVIFVNAKAKVFTDSTEPAIEVSAQAGIDVNKKGMDTSQTFGSSSSYARKYALNGLFLIDDTQDADATNNHGNSTPAKAKEKLPKSGEKFEAAKKFIKSGGSITDIKKKYDVTSQIEKLLNQ